MLGQRGLASTPTRAYQRCMEMRPLYLNGPRVSVLGLGTVKLGRREGVKYPEPFDLPSDEQAAKLLAKAQSLGINLIDTAPAYGTSEARLGELLGGERDEWVIVTKVGETFENGESTFDFSPGAVRASVERSLARLRTDRVDAVLLHSDGNDTEIIERSGAFAELIKLREQGLIGAFGVSTKTVEGGMLAVDRLSDSGGGVVMLTHNLAHEAERCVIDHAHGKGIGVLIKKGLQSGRAGDPGESIRFVLGTPGVSSMVVGTINEAHLEQNSIAAGGVG